MGIKTSQIIYDVKELLNQYSDDSDYSDKHILYLYNLKRSKYLRQLLDDKSRTFDKIMIQSLCLEFEEVDKSICELTVGCTVLRSKKPLPTLLPVRNRDTLLSIQPSIALSKPFKVIDINQANYILDRPYSNAIYATVNNEGYIYIFSNTPEHKLISCLYINGIFNDPSDLENYSNCCECEDKIESCFTEESDYPAPAFIIDAARDDIIKLFLGSKEQVKEDKNNNSDDE